MLRRFRKRPLRAFLTLLQIVLGALAMTLALSAYIDAYQRQNAAKPDRFNLIAGWRTESGMMMGGGSFFDRRTVKDVLALAPDVEQVSMYNWGGQIKIEYDNRLYEFMQGAYVDENYFALNDIEITSGSVFTSKEFMRFQAVAVISDSAAKQLYGETNPIGQTFNVITDAMYAQDWKTVIFEAKSEEFKVIGTFADATGPQAVDQNYVYLPLWKGISSAEGGAGMLSVLAKGGKGDSSREQILEAVRQTYRPKYAQYNTQEGKDFFISELGESLWSNTQTNYIDPTVVMFGLFGIVALLVGSIGIFSIMLVDTLERERDTGIKRALGATKGRITREMTLEATVLAGLGGLLGVLSASVILPLLEQRVSYLYFSQFSLRWEPWAAVIVFALTLLLGMVLGFFPALRASSIKPVEALKSV